VCGTSGGIVAAALPNDAQDSIDRQPAGPGDGVAEPPRPDVAPNVAPMSSRLVDGIWQEPIAGPAMPKPHAALVICAEHNVYISGDGDVQQLKSSTGEWKTVATKDALTGSILRVADGVNGNTLISVLNPDTGAVDTWAYAIDGASGAVQGSVADCATTRSFGPDLLCVNRVPFSISGLVD